MKIFNICTITNNLNQYEQMKASFIEAGFSEERCRYTLFDNSEVNLYDPTVFNSVRLTTEEPYIIFCHQDILLDKGDGFDKLVQALDELDRLDPKWAVAGNAGITKRFEFVSKITDPNSHYYPEWRKGFPYEVQSLDENFLVIRSAAKVTCQLNTFYLYGHELCLDAMTKGYSCHVINFHLTHLSSGKYDHDGHSPFRKAVDSFRNKWNHKFIFRYYLPVYAPMMCFSRYKVLRQIGAFSIFIRYQILNLCRPLYVKSVQRLKYLRSGSS